MESMCEWEILCFSHHRVCFCVLGSMTASGYLLKSGLGAWKVGEGCTISIHLGVLWGGDRNYSARMAETLSETVSATSGSDWGRTSYQWLPLHRLPPGE
jgi:hypothetical protein